MDPTVTVILLLGLGVCVSADVLPEGPVDVVLGGDATLTTLVSGSFSFIIWNFNNGEEQVNVGTLGPEGLKLQGPYVGRVAVNASNGFLTLKGAAAADSGDYAINLIKANGETQTGEIQLRVLEPVSAVVIKSSVPEAVELNDTVTLTCSAKGSFLTFTWTNGSAPLKPDGKRVIVKDGETSSVLTVSGVLRSDLVGPVFCSAANKLEKETSAAFNLTVHYGPEQVSVTPTVSTRFVRSGSNFSLTCSALSSPAAALSWFRDGAALTAAALGPVLSLATIEKTPGAKTEGKYTCVAHNAKTGRKVASAPVTFAVMDGISGVKITGPTGTLVAGNSSANLSCAAASGAVTTVTWRRDGQVLAPGARLTFSHNHTRLSIDPLTKDEAGVYTCQLSNAVNKEQDTFKMVVNYGPEAAVVSGAEAVEVNTLVTLTCAAPSFPPANFTWKFNGTKTETTAPQLVIAEAKYKNSGTYTCAAHNHITGRTATGQHKLSVKEEGALDEGLSDGAIAGIVIGVLVALAAAIGLIVYCRQKVPVESPY